MSLSSFLQLFPSPTRHWDTNMLITSIKVVLQAHTQPSPSSTSRAVEVEHIQKPHWLVVPERPQLILRERGSRRFVVLWWRIGIFEPREKDCIVTHTHTTHIFFPLQVKHNALMLLVET